MKHFARLLGVSLAVVWALACSREGNGNDGHTSWLGPCSADADCGPGTTCLCSLCTVPCTRTAECGALGSPAICVSGSDLVPGCPGNAPASERICAPDELSRPGDGGADSSAPGIDADARGPRDLGTVPAPCAPATDAGLGRPIEQRRWVESLTFTLPVPGRVTPRVALNAAGRGLLSWSQYDGARYHVMVRRFDQASGFGPTEQLDPPTPAGTPPLDRTQAGTYVVYPGDATDPRPFASPLGDLFVTWLETEGEIPYQRDHVWISRHVDGSGWDPGGACSCGQELSVDGAGRALSIATALVGGTRFEQRATRFDPALGWGTPVVLGSTLAGEPARLAVARDGQALAAWQADSGIDVWAFDPENGWAPEYSYEDPVPAEHTSIGLGLDACGGALLTWERLERGRDFDVTRSAWWTGRNASGPFQPSTLLSPDALGASLRLSSTGFAAAIEDHPFGATFLLKIGAADWFALPSELAASSLLMGITDAGELLTIAPTGSGTVVARPYSFTGARGEATALEGDMARDLAVSTTGEALLVTTDALESRIHVFVLQ